MTKLEEQLRKLQSDIARKVLSREGRPGSAIQSERDSLLMLYGEFSQIQQRLVEVERKSLRYDIVDSPGGNNRVDHKNSPPSLGCRDYPEPIS